VADRVNVLFVADIVGRPGRRAVGELVPRLRERFSIDLCVANGENAAGGFGLTPEISRDLLGNGVDVLTSGNHLWDRKEILPYLEEERSLLRPANYPPGTPGHRSVVCELPRGRKVAVFCLQGRVFLHDADCPFRIAEVLVSELRKETSVIFVDFHAEATSEKIALGWFLDGRVSAVIGSHTHVQTADERVLPGGTAYLTDAGMTGPFDSVIGIEKAAALNRFLTQVPTRFTVASGDVRLSGAVITIDPDSGRATGIQTLHESLQGEGSRREEP
jgi:metallophosphoesterase (TIGR00282 family)